ncbi:hypothetical protein CL614_08625 [archaeon]|nr:hypothetical protein [archaeon]|tara:strand:+ start:868 stop:1440 length:573 start_codon:yes stop_codon:yes gene_type:complete
MKIRIKESQLNNLLNEVGGYDAPEVMGIHGGSVHGEITRIVATTVDFIKEFSERLTDGSLSKEELMAGILNFSEKIQVDIQRLGELAREIYIDDDFKSLVIAYVRALQKVLKYFKLLSNISPGLVGGQPQMFGGGLGMDMTQSELSVEVAKKLAGLGEYIESLGEMFYKIVNRFGRRMSGDDDFDLDINM